MIYTLDEYAEKIAKCHRNTLLKRINNEMLPSTHIVRKGRQGKQYMIEVKDTSERCHSCEVYFIASCEYHEKKKLFNIEYNAGLAAELCVKHNLGATKFFKMMGL
jgi:hypothetical protein